MNRHGVGGGQRIGDDDHARSGQQGHAIFPGNEARRHEEQLALRGVDEFTQLGRKVGLVFRGTREHLFGMIMDDGGRTPEPGDRAVLELPGKLAAPHLVSQISLVGFMKREVVVPGKLADRLNPLTRALGV